MEAIMKNLFLILVTFLFVANLVQAQDNAELKKQVQAMNDKMSAMMLSGDQETIWEYYSEDVISMPSYQPMMKGIDACKESSKKMMESGMKITDFKSVNTDLLVSGDYLIDIGTYKITMTMPQMGDMPYTDNGKYMTVWEMQDDGSMKVVVETWNTDTNPWEEMQKMAPPPPPSEGHDGHNH
jgi:ketosteroid isomerase-like protein